MILIGSKISESSTTVNSHLQGSELSSRDLTNVPSLYEIKESIVKEWRIVRSNKDINIALSLPLCRNITMKCNEQ